LETPPLPEPEDAPWLQPRLWALMGLAGVMFAGFGARLYYLNVLRGPEYFELSENNFLMERRFGAPRGNLLARDGTVLALNRVYYQVEMSPFRLNRSEIEVTLERVANLLGRPDVRRLADAVARTRPRWARLTLATNLSEEAIQPLLERRFELPGVQVSPLYSRLHPEGQLLGHVTGFIGRIAPQQLERAFEEGYLRNDFIGKLGAELEFEAQLRGTHGREIQIRDAAGRPRAQYIQEPAQRGQDVVLTIDLSLQRRADELLEGHRGSILALDPRTGEVLAMVNKPDFDPNHPMRGADEGLTSQINLALRGRFSPGSVFKLVTAAAGLAHGFSPGQKINCPGYFLLEGVEKPFYCDVRSGHGTIDLTAAIERSCNVYFYHWAADLGAERLVAAARAFGFGRLTGIDLAYEGAGHLVEPGQRPIYRGSVVQMGIGQGALVAVTPLQVLIAYVGLAAGGALSQPHILAEIRPPNRDFPRAFVPRRPPERLPLSAEHRALLIEALRRVVRSPAGTGYRVNFDPAWDVAGKTGSAEVAGQALTDGWFVAFAPASAPEICILAAVLGEGHGADTAGPLVRDLFEMHFARRVGPSAGRPPVSDSSRSPLAEVGRPALPPLWSAPEGIDAP